MLRRLLPVALTAALLVACRGEPKVMRVEIAVEGMVCESCVEGITYELERIEGVQTASVDLESGKATVTYAEGSTDPAALEQTIEKLGYGATPGEATPIAE